MNATSATDTGMSKPRSTAGLLQNMQSDAMCLEAILTAVKTCHGYDERAAICEVMINESLEIARVLNNALDRVDLQKEIVA